MTGTIAVARYGGIFRGLKVREACFPDLWREPIYFLQVKGAQERGAVGCIIYSDPRDDGSVTWDNGYAACGNQYFACLFADLDCSVTHMDPQETLHPFRGDPSNSFLSTQAIQPHRAIRHTKTARARRARIFRRYPACLSRGARRKDF